MISAPGRLFVSDRNRSNSLCPAFESIEKKFQIATDFAGKQGLPLVVDEGGILHPPQKSRFVMMPEGRDGEEVFVNTAIATGHWGILPTGYTRPDTLTWHDPSQIEWVQRMNRRILETKTKTAGAREENELARRHGGLLRSPAELPALTGRPLSG